MAILRTLILCSTGAVALLAQQGTVSGPVSGYVFDARGHSLRIIRGIPGASLFGVDTPGQVESQTAYTYDGLDRVVAERLLAGNSDAGEKWRTTYAYGGDWTTVTPPAGGIPTTTVVVGIPPLGGVTVVQSPP